MGLQFNKGYKLDEGKPRWGLLPIRALKEVVKVFTFGAKKYSDHNWLQGMKWSKIYDALNRHITSFWDGEEYDTETRLHHLAHATACCLMLLTYVLFSIFHKLDDRPIHLIKKLEQENGNK